MKASHGFRLGLGPVFAYEWIVLTRRWQWYALRSLFAGMLLAALTVVLLNQSVSRGAMSFRQLATLGQTFSIAVIGTQLTLVLLAAPAATAGSICLDRASGSLTHLLVTDLSDTEIILGKLAARLVPVLGLVACALPLLAILTLLGGVDPKALFGSFLVTVGVALLGCSLALVFSLWAKRTHEALLATYAVWGLWLVGKPFLDLINRAFGLGLLVPPAVADPYRLAFAPFWSPATARFADNIWFLAITSGLALALVVVAVFQLRPSCTRVSLPRTSSLRGRFARLSRRLDPMGYLPGPTLDFNPVLWREWHRARPSRWGRVIGGLFLVVALVASVGSLLVPRTVFATAWVNGLQVSIGLLLLSVTAATSLAEERVRGSLDVLMATTLSTREIVLGKWMAAFRLVPALAILPMIVALLTNPTQSRSLLVAFLILEYVIVGGAAIIGLGLVMATYHASLGRAVALTVTCYILVAVGWLFACLSMDHRLGAEGMMMASPFMFAGGLTADLIQNHRPLEHLGWAVIWLIFYAFVAMALLGVTLMTFNRCLGRVEMGVAERLRDRSGNRSRHVPISIPKPNAPPAGDGLA